MYRIEISQEAAQDLLKLKKSSPQTFKKFESLISELREHPYTGTEHPHQLRHIQGIWSRSLDKKNRLRYSVNDDLVVVYVISALGHYDNK